MFTFPVSLFSSSGAAVSPYLTNLLAAFNMGAGAGNNEPDQHTSGTTLVASGSGGNKPGSAAGRNGNCRTFDGVNSQLLSGTDDPTFRLNASGWTMRFYVYFDSVGGAVGVIGKENDSTNREYRVDNPSGTALRFVPFGSNNNVGAVTSSVTLSAATFYDCAVRIDSTAGGTFGRVAIFVNGTKTDAALTAAPTASTATFTVGNYGGGNQMAGRIDELYLWNRALSDAEIIALYGGGTAPLFFPTF